MKREVSARLLVVPLVLLVVAGCQLGNQPIDGAASAPSTSAPNTTSVPTATSSPPSASNAAGTSSGAPSTSRTTASAAPASNAAPSRTCGSPAFTTSDPDGGWSSGGYYVHNNMWNRSEAGPETLHACAYNNWYVDSAQANSTSVKTYPNVHKDINNLNGTPFSKYSAITTTFAGRGPGVGIYDVAYDIWLNGVGDGPGVTELMVWTENLKQVPSGSKTATYSAGGVGYDVWKDNGGYIAFVAQTTQYSGSVDLKAMIAWAIGKGLMPNNPTVNQIGYGIEFCSTGGGKARFTLTDFSVAMS
jgi:hypothetical protein